jgi:hypothetical protein
VFGKITAARSHRALPRKTWGQKRIAKELELKLGMRVSPRIVWEIPERVACDFFVGCERFGGSLRRERLDF